MRKTAIIFSIMAAMFFVVQFELIQIAIKNAPKK